MTQHQAPAAFDQLAGEYDDTFTTTALGRALREAVWRHVDPLVVPGGRALDLGCGTGVDSERLAAAGMRVVAVDASPNMVEITSRRLTRFGDQVSVTTGSIDALDDLPPCSGEFDLVLSNFGALNCVHDLGAALQSVAARLKIGGRFIAVVMGPLVPVEWLWMGLSGRPTKVFRRLRPGGVEWRGIRVRYPSLPTFRRAAPSSLKLHRQVAIGALLPPSEAARWIERRPRLLAFLNRIERSLESMPPLPRLADHYLVELVRS